jgi:ubiquitin C-terminal hydrolase
VEGLKSIEQSLQLYTRDERLTDYKCDKCESKKCLLKRQIMRLPSVFIFQLQRFSMYPTMRKIRGLIAFPEVIDMAPYIDRQYSSEAANA